MAQDEIQEHFNWLGWDEGIGWEHADALVEIGEPAVPYLIKALNKRYGEGMRLRAANALGKIGDPVAAKALGEALLKDESHHVWYEAREALVKFGRPAVPYLIKVLKRRKEQRFYVANALGEIGDPAATEALAEVLREDFGSSVYKAAEEALIKIGDAAVPHLIKTLKGGSEKQRIGAAGVLGEIGGPAAAEALTEALKDKYSTVRDRAELSLKWHFGEKKQ